MRLFLKRKKPPPRETGGRVSPWGSVLLTAALLPSALAVFPAVGQVLRELAGRRLPFVPLLAGAAAYGLFQLAFDRPMRAYVFGHELTHAAAAWLHGFRVKSMSVSARGGEVVLTDSSTAVALAPYCVPLYTLLAVALFEALRRFTDLPLSGTWLAFAVGFTYAFHAALTAYALMQNQPDLKHAGVALSLTLILLVNAAVLVLLLNLLFPAAVSLKAFGARWAAGTLVIWDAALAVSGGAVRRSWDAVRPWAGRLGEALP
jgi:hypothetical protein